MIVYFITGAILFCSMFLLINIANCLERDYVIFLKKAQEIIRQRFIKREQSSVKRFINSFNFKYEDEKKAQKLLFLIATFVGVELEYVCLEFPIKELYTVQTSDVLKVANYPRRRVLPDRLELYADDLIDVLLRLIRKTKWDRYVKDHNYPQNYQEFYELILTMNSRELINFLVPLM